MDKDLVCQAKKEAEVAWTKYSLLKDLYTKAENEYLEKRKRFEELDYQLALVDGRLKKLPPSGDGQKVKKQPELSLEQIKGIAEKLGVKLTIEEEPESEEEVQGDEM